MADSLIRQSSSDKRIARLSRRTKSLIQLDKKYLWHPFTQMKDWLADPEPLVIESGKGCFLKDTQGRRYLDGVSSLWVNIHGHNHPSLNRAIQAQLKKISHSTLLGLANVPSILLARDLIKVAPRGLSRVFYSDSGSTAVEVALKIAYQYWQNQGGPAKKRVLFLTQKEAYHGDTIGSVSLGYSPVFHRGYRPLLFKTHSYETPYCYRCPLGLKHPACRLACLDSLEKLLKIHAGRVAAVVAEPLVQGAAGMITAPKGHFKKVRRLCDKHGVLLVADEVATGFGRTGTMFACQSEGVTPDLMAVAKGLSGGTLPLAATLATEKIFKGFLFPFKDQKAFFHGHTYTGNPLACAAASASLGLFKKENTLRKLQPKIKRLAKGLERFWKLKHVGDVRQKGFMAGIELVKEKQGKTPYAWDERAGARVCRLAREQGAILRPLGPVVVLMPPLSITLPQLDRLLDITFDSIRLATERGMP